MTDIEIVEAALKEVRGLQHRLNTVADSLTAGLAELREREALVCARKSEERLKIDQQTNALLGRILDTGLHLAEQSVQRLKQAEAKPKRLASKRTRT